ncbi:MAG: hypothetical protein JWN37_851 [Candidatus Nomurabacteria bacterium]|nr:hypothetical protein [Candidatus Nomurabacteria bacterium]
MPFSFKPSQANQSTSSDVSGASSSSLSSLSFSSRLPEGVGFFQKILYGIFGIFILAAIALFGYHWYLGSQITSKQQLINDYEAKLGGLPLEDMRALSNRIKYINVLVKNHPSENAAFRLLEESVENPVTYSRFDLRYDDAKKTYLLALTATAPDYKTIVQQMETLKNKPYSSYISDLAIAGLHPDDTGKVGFDLKMNIAISGVLPEELVLGVAPPVEPLNVSTTTATSSASLIIPQASSTKMINPTATGTLPKLRP